MKPYRYIICFILFYLIQSATHAQRQNNNWCFGQNLRLNFNADSPVLMADSMQVIESSSSVSDDNGNLLFYTSGAFVWDRNNHLMPNGTGLSGNGPMMPD